jgi:hypothetical protein
MDLAGYSCTVNLRMSACLYFVFSCEAGEERGLFHEVKWDR